MKNNKKYKQVSSTQVSIIKLNIVKYLNETLIISNLVMFLTLIYTIIYRSIVHDIKDMQGT